jgi:hypothetical protein
MPGRPMTRQSHVILSDLERDPDWWPSTLDRVACGTSLKEILDEYAVLYGVGRRWVDADKRAVTRWHRRSGKDEVFLHHTACAAHERIGNYWYMPPAVFAGAKSDVGGDQPKTGKRRIDEAFPLEIRATTREHEMMIPFKCGSTFQLVGSDNFNSLVGSPPVGLVFSEYALSDPSAWAYLMPILEENGGWAGFNSTPRGNNHFKNICKLAEQGRLVLRVADRRPDRRFLARAASAHPPRASGHHGEEYGKALWLQEYFVSFDAAIPGHIGPIAWSRPRRRGGFAMSPVNPLFRLLRCSILAEPTTPRSGFSRWSPASSRGRLSRVERKDIPVLREGCASRLGQISTTRHRLRRRTGSRTTRAHEHSPAGGKSILQQFDRPRENSLASAASPSFRVWIAKRAFKPPEQRSRSAGSTKTPARTALRR